MIQSLLLIAALVGDPAVWPTFLGRGASTVDAASIPLKWSPTENIAWKAKLPGKGQSSPVIWGDKVFVTCIEGSMKDTCHIVAISLSDGKEVWRQSLPSAQPVRSTYTQSRSAPTPAVDQNGVYAFFETGNVVACSHDGKLKWQRDLTEDYGLFESTIGLASSPTVYQDTMILLIDHEGPSYLLGLDTATGEAKWKTDRTSRSSYASPTLLQIAGKTQVVCSSSGSVDGFDPATGELLWTFEESVGGNKTGAPMPIADGVFTISGTPGMHSEREAEARNTNLALKVELVDGSYVPKVLWRTTEAMPSHNSPMSHDGLSYWVSKAGIVYCYNSATGEQVYAKRACGTCWATPVALGNRIYLFGKDGATVVIAAGQEFNILSENMLWNPDEVGRDSRPGGGSMSGSGSGRGSRGGHASGDQNSNEHGEHSATTNDATQGVSSKTVAATDNSTKQETASRSTATDKPATQAKNDAQSGADSVSAQPTRRGRPERSEGTTEKADSTTGQPTTDGSSGSDARFADPVQYGVAIVNGSLIIRTGEVVYCVRNVQP